MTASQVSLGGAGKLMSIGAKISDGTGVTITVTTAGTPVPLLSATLLLVDKDDTGGAITFDPATGVFTVAKQNGLGKYLALASVGQARGVNAKKIVAQWFAKENGVAAAVKGIKAAKTEPATAADGAIGVAQAVLDFQAVGDTAEIRLDSTTNGDTVLVKDAHLELIKIA
jgi:hypothetical protein